MTYPLSQKAIALLDGLEESSDACNSWDFTAIRQALIKLQELETSNTTVAKLSPAAQAVLNGFRAVPDLRDCPSIAGALRAVADQVLPLHLPPELAVDANGPTVEWHIWNAEQQARFALLSIANELEASEVTS